MTPKERNLADIGLIALRHGLTRFDILQRRGRMPLLPEARLACVKHFAAQGKGNSEIGRIMDRDHSTIRYYIDGKQRGSLASN